jgi:dihydrolipoamide dehydrogenase
MVEVRKMDLIILGGGPGGYSAALRGRVEGLNVCLIEKERVGGTCLNWGCFPTKSMLGDALLYSQSKASEFLIGEIHFNFEKVMARKDDVVNKLVQGIETVLTNRGVELIAGEGELVDSKNVVVKRKYGSEISITSGKIIVATGAKLDPSPFRTDGKKILSHRDALTLKVLPKSLAIIGAGRRGVEFGTIFRSLGCQVVLIEKGRRILQQEDEEISQRLRRILTLQGIQVMINTEAVESEISADGMVTLTLQTSKDIQKINVEALLVPGKRIGNTENVNLKGLLRADQDHFLEVKENFETSVSGIYGVGDVNGKGFVAHKSIVEGILAVDGFTGKSMKINPGLIPRCTYTNPEVGSIGLTQREAEEKGEGIEVGKFPMGASGRAITLGQDQGVLKIIFGKKYGEILGVHILAPQATELISLASFAMRNEMGIEELKASIFGHPTISESFFEAALDVKGEAIHFLKGASE